MTEAPAQTSTPAPAPPSQTSAFAAPPANIPPSPISTLPDGTPPAVTAPTGDPANWFAKLSADDQKWAESKGWKADTDPGAIASSYQNLEKLFGADKAGRTLVLPKDENDKAAIDAIYDKLGRPKDAKEYDLALPEGFDPALTDQAKTWFHKAGLSGTQAKAVFDSYRAVELDTLQKLDAVHAQEVEGLRTEWGSKFEQNVEVGKAAIKAAALNEAQIKALERALGPASTARMLEFYGRQYVEAKPPGNESRTSPTFSNMTPASANTEMERLRGDPNFMSRYSHQDPKIRTEAMQQMDKLAQLAVNANSR